MIVYNELVAITAGAGLLGFAAFLADLIRSKRINSEGWAAFFGVTGLVLLVTGLHTTVTWPFGGGGFEYANIAFGQPAAGFGALLLLAAVYLWRHRRSSPATSRPANGGSRRAEAGRHLRRRPRSRHGSSGHHASSVSSWARLRRRNRSAAASATCRSSRPCSWAACGGSSPSARCSSRSHCGPTGSSCSAGPSGPGSSAAWCSCCSGR